MKKNFSSHEQTKTTNQNNTPLNKKNILGRRRTILLKNKCERIHKDRRKHYVVFHKWNQSKCTKTSRARCRFFVLKNTNLKVLSQPHDEVLMMTDSKYINYKANEERKIFKDGLLFRKYFGETSSVEYYQFLIPK